jgi:hypothetical protein
MATAGHEDLEVCRHFCYAGMAGGFFVGLFLVCATWNDED